MAIEQFLLVRSDGQKEKSKPFDKLDTTALSFFACIPNSPTTQGFSFLGGFAYIGQSFVVVSDVTVSMGTAGNHATTAIPANYWNVAIFSVNSLGALVMTQGVAAASQGAVVLPIVPPGTIPAAQVFFQDNGSGLRGSILPIQPANINDIRPFFFSNYGLAEPFAEVIADFQVTPTYPASTNLNAAPGNLYFSYGTFVQFAGSPIALAGGQYEVPALTPNYYNKALISLNFANKLTVDFGTQASTVIAVVPPAPLPGHVPLAMVTVQDNGSGLAGSILPIVPSAILDVRPLLQNILGQIPTSDLDYLRVTSTQPSFPSPKVIVHAGVVYPTPDRLIQFPTTPIDFSTGAYQNPAIPANYWQRLLLVLDTSGNVDVYRGTPQVTQTALTNLYIPLSTLPLAYVDVQDNGSAGPGTILDIIPQNITDVRPWLTIPSEVTGTVASAGVPLTALEAVYISGGEAYPVNATNIAEIGFFGFTTTSIAASASGYVAAFGVLDGFTGLVQGATYYADPFNPGGITITKPSTPEQYVVPVGLAISSTALVINTQAGGGSQAIDLPATGLISPTLPTNTSSVDISSTSQVLSNGVTFAKQFNNYVINYTGSTVNFQTGTVTGDGSGTFIAPNTVIGSGNYRWYSLTLTPNTVNSDNELTMTVSLNPASADGTSSANAPLANYLTGVQLGQVLLQNVGGTIQPVGYTEIIEQDGTGSGAGGSGTSLTPADGFQFVLAESPFASPDGSPGSNIDPTETTGSYSGGKKLYEMLCDKSIAISTTGTAYSLSHAPTGFSIDDGCIIWINSLNTWARIANVVTQTTGTLDASFSSNQASAAGMVSQAVTTLDLTAIGDATHHLQGIDIFPGVSINQLSVSYADSLSVSDNVFDPVVTANIVVSASNAGAQGAIGSPLSSTYSSIFTRPSLIPVGGQLPALPNYNLSVNSPEQRLFLTFFPNPNNGAVTSQANLLSYAASFYSATTLNNGGYLNSAFVMTDGSGTSVNASVAVVGGYTQVTLSWSYVPGLNVYLPSTVLPDGDLEVIVEGLVIPRFFTGILGQYYTEVSPYVIQLSANYSASPYSVQVRRRQGSIDTADQNALNINVLQSDVTTIDGEISVLQSDVTTLQSDVTTLQSDVTTLQSDVVAIQSQLSMVPQITVLTDTSGPLVYNVPVGAKYLEVEITGAGAGGAGGGANGTNGTNSIFKNGATTLLTAAGGLGGTTILGGAGGDPTVDISITSFDPMSGGDGDNGYDASLTGAGGVGKGGLGGTNGLGGAGAGGPPEGQGNPGSGGNGKANTGAGGGGGSWSNTGIPGNSGGGGGAGARIKAIITGLVTSYTCQVGIGGPGGSSSGYEAAGGNGADGKIVIKVYYV